MIAIEAIMNQVLQNCNIADSQHAGLYSICGLALRLRDLYKWENGLDPWVEKDSAEVLEWIGAKEQKWEELAEKGFNAITIMGNKYDPFDTSGIDAFQEFTHTRHWDLVIKATAEGFNTARYHAEAISDIFQKGMQKNDKQWIENEIAMRLLRPLGVT
ncbi:MAG: hypothetical protein V3S16_15865 [Candidatus Desulfatibia sp.]|uniref:Sfum_1244 family protein n=1 Tax=Candidatus Desulfatibia sp. TaxID=3101189 RepID=UPI002F2D8F91